MSWFIFSLICTGIVILLLTQGSDESFSVRGIFAMIVSFIGFFAWIKAVIALFKWLF